MPTLSGTPPLTAEQMADLRDDAMAMQVVLSGVFDDHIEELRQVQADITLKQEALIALDEVNSIRGVAEKYAATVKSQADELFDKANKTLSDAENRANQVAQQQKDVDTASAELKAKQADFAKSKRAAEESLQADRDKTAGILKAARDDFTEREKLLVEGNANLTEAQIQLSQEQAEVASLKARLTAKLESFAKVEKQ